MVGDPRAVHPKVCRMHCQHMDIVLSNFLWEMDLRLRLRKFRIVATSKFELMELEVASISITHDCHKSAAIGAVDRIGISVLPVAFCEPSPADGRAWANCSDLHKSSRLDRSLAAISHGDVVLMEIISTKNASRRSTTVTVERPHYRWKTSF